MRRPALITTVVTVACLQASLLMATSYTLAEAEAQPVNAAVVPTPAAPRVRPAGTDSTTTTSTMPNPDGTSVSSPEPAINKAPSSSTTESSPSTDSAQLG